MKVGIVGCGFVGSATALLAAHNGHSSVGFDVNADASLKMSEQHGSHVARKIDDLTDCDIIFICVPTEPDSNGACDLSIYDATVRELIRVKSNTPFTVVQRSTCPPGTAKLYSELFEMRYAVFPSFLAKSTWQYDAVNPSRLILAGEESSLKLMRSFLGSKPDIEPFYCESFETAELLKYVDNVVDSCLIALWNEFFCYASRLGINAENFIHLLSAFPMRDRFATAWRVPGGAFGKHCFPKDVDALAHSMESLGVNAELISAIANSNRVSLDILGENELASSDMLKCNDTGVRMSSVAKEFLKTRMGSL